MTEAAAGGRADGAGGAEGGGTGLGVSTRHDWASAGGFEGEPRGAEGRRKSSTLVVCTNYREAVVQYGQRGQRGRQRRAFLTWRLMAMFLRTLQRVHQDWEVDRESALTLNARRTNGTITDGADAPPYVVQTI